MQVDSPTNSKVQFALKQLEFARHYSTQLIDSIEEEHWFCIPEGCVTHLAWQIGHLSMAQYMLTLFRVRGRQNDDEKFIPRKFLKKFLKGTEPDADQKSYPTAAEILEVFMKTHDRVITELATFSDEQLVEPVIMPYAVEPTQLGSILFCSHHEMLHAGQIGLLRRRLGYAPLNK
ncbi:MAG: DinB family protein [Pirellulaceae bacterium]|nr:DinB family protein [Pirellulaceae bacterium]